MGRGRRAHPAAGPAVVEVAGTEHRIHRLRLGVLDEAAVSCFTQGQCHALALALHERTGWPIVAVCDWLEDVDHVAVRTPEGLILDAAGAHEAGRFADAWDGDLVEMSAERLARVSASATWREPAMEVARALVAPVLGYRDAGRPSLEPGPRALGPDTVAPAFARVRRRDGGHVEVRDGILDEPARALFGGEQAGALASALWLAEETGSATLVLVSDDEGEPTHAALRLPDGRYLDADGSASAQAFAARRPGRIRQVRRPSELDEELAGCFTPWPAQDVAAAQLVVAPLLSAAGIAPRPNAQVS